MHRGGGMGMDRGSRVGGSGQNGYRRGYGHRPGYGRDADNSYADHSGSGYDHGGKYEQERGVNGSRHEEHGHAAAGRHAGGAFGQNGHSNNGHCNNEETLPQALIESLEQKIVSAHSEMSQALHDITGKENEKFDLIFGILIELQRRQATLEESVRQLKSQMPSSGGMGSTQQQAQQSLTQGQSQPTQGGQMGNQMGSQANAQMNNQGNSQNNGQMYMGNQMNMAQQYGNVVTPDGSQAVWTNMPTNVVLVAAPQGMAPQGMQGIQQMGQGMQQMCYAGPQMMSGPMQPQMAMQYVSQDQSGGNFQQWGATDDSQQASARTNGIQMTPQTADKSMGQGSTTTGGDTPDGNEADFRIEDD